MKELLTTLLGEAFAEIEQARNGVLRAVKFPETSQMIKVIIGMRRSGKTYTLYQQKSINYSDQGLAKERILFIDFEGDRLFPMTARKMAELIDDFYLLYPENNKRKCYVFLDEVQLVDNWHQVVRYIFKSKPIELTITGSSAKLLSTEINNSLRGRSLATEVLPLMNIVLRAICLHQNHLIAGEPMILLVSNYKIFLTKVIFLLFSICSLMIDVRHYKTTFDTVILKGIIERHSISNTTLLKYLAKTLLINAATPFSINKFYNDIKS